MSNQDEMEYLELRGQWLARRETEQLQPPSSLDDVVARELARPSETTNQRHARELLERDARWAQERRARARAEAASAAQQEASVAAAWSGYVQASLAAEREQVFSAVAEVLAREVKRLDGERQEVARLALDELAEFDTLASRIARLEGRPGADAKGKALEEKWGRLGGPAS